MKKNIKFELPKFHNTQLLRQALTHPSYLNEHPEETEDNQRLEFLGDCVLGFLVGAMLYEQFPDMQEGELTRRRSTLVDEPNLARLAREMGIGGNLRIGRGAELDGGRESPSILSDAFEALVGAYFLDSGIDAVKSYVQQIFSPSIKSVTEHRSTIDAKSRFQQWVQANCKGVLPEYLTTSMSGPDHAKTFTVAVYVEGKKYGDGSGSSKKEAEKQAATDALGGIAKQRLQNWAQTEFKLLPDYRLIETGSINNKTFSVTVFVGDLSYGVGEGRSKKDAEKQAAIDACSRLEIF